MRRSRDDLAPLSAALSDRAGLAGRFLQGADATVALDALAAASSLAGAVEELRGRSVLVATRDQLTAALALIELDGVARRLVLRPPDLAPEHVPAVVEAAAVEAVVSDETATEAGPFGAIPVFPCRPLLVPMAGARVASHRTEWVLLTSGTTGRPKLVLHDLGGLAGAIGAGMHRAGAGGARAAPAIWATFYDIRRYGGLQIFLRAVLDGGSLVLSSASEPTAEFLARAGRHGVTHISGTPSHWRHALMSPAARRISPRYVRLSGEIADQAILDKLRHCYGEAEIAHAFASTEAGVAFDVRDGLAGFPASLVGRGAAVEMKIAQGSLHIRSARTAMRYLGEDAGLADADGFVDTGDMVELRGDRYHFVGRRGGIINVGGFKVHPEEVEAVINRHPSVEMSLVKARRNPITGAVVAAEIVVTPPGGGAADPGRLEAVKREVLEDCRRSLAPYKVPAAIRVVPAVGVAASGKLARRDA